jgi:hypothetical protein
MELAIKRMVEAGMGVALPLVGVSLAEREILLL